MSEKEKKKKSKKGLLLFVVLIMATLILLLGVYLGRFGFGAGKGGIFAFLGATKNGTEKTNTTDKTDKLVKGFKFYFNHDKIIYQKEEISLEKFKEYVSTAKAKEEIIELFFVEINMTKDGYDNVKKVIGDMTVREVNIEPDKLPK